SIFADRAPNGMVLLRALCGGWHRADIVTWNDARLLSAVTAELRLTLGIKVPPRFTYIVRWERAIPQYHVGHLERAAWIEASVHGHPGLLVGGNAYHGVALNDCIDDAERLAAEVVLALSG